MKKRILASLLVAVMAIGLAACGGAKENTSSDSAPTDAGETEEERTEFVVGFDAEFPPFGYIAEDGSYTGLDLDLAQEVCDRNGWELKRQPIDWPSKDMEITSGTIDCIWNGFTCTGREDEYTWTVPYIDSNIMVVVRDESDIQELADLEGKKVCVQTDSSGYRGMTSETADPEKKALAESFASLDQIDDYNTAFEYLKSGAVDAVVVDILNGYAHMDKEEGMFRMLDEEMVVEQCAVGFKLGNDKLRDVVQDTMFEMLEDGTFMSIVDKYADQYVTQEMICLERYK